MRTIYKYQVHIGEDTFVDTHKDAKFAHFDLQDNNLFIWLEVDTYSPYTQKVFHVYGTGWDIASYGKHLASTVAPNGYVWHLYEE